VKRLLERQIIQTFLLGAVVASFFAAFAAAQSPPFVAQSVPTGQHPAGVAAGNNGVPALAGGSYWAAVADSGENSVSLFTLVAPTGYTRIGPSVVIPGIASPYGVIACDTGDPLIPGNLRFIVTSPSANSVSVIDPVQGKVVGSVMVGSGPYSADCAGNNVYVSNYGDSTLSVVDLNSLTVSRTISGVPGSRALHGILAPRNDGLSAGNTVWVAGTDANMVTILDATSLAVLTTIPVHSPTFVRYLTGNAIPVPQILIGIPPDNMIFAFSEANLSTVGTISVPTPQDFFNNGLGASPFGQFVTTGPGNSVVAIRGTSTTVVPNIPGASGLAGGTWIHDIAHTLPIAAFVLATSPDSNSIVLIQQQPATPNAFTVSNGASFGTMQVAAGQLASFFATTGVSQNFYASIIPLPRALGGVSLKIGGTLTFNATTGNWDYLPTGALDAPLVFVGPSQVNFQIPPGTPLGDSVPVELTKPDGTTLLSTVSITATAPGIFSVLMNGQGQGAVLNQNNSQNFGTNPAARGSIIQIFATGGGDTTPLLAPGDAAPVSGNPLVQTNAQPTVTIGGISEAASFSGMAPGFVGLWQINAEVPAAVTPGSAVPLSVNIGGVQSNTVTIAVQ
jgi:uncharacterized protein (TIGR03437 family)